MIYNYCYNTENKDIFWNTNGVRRNETYFDNNNNKYPFDNSNKKRYSFNFYPKNCLFVVRCSQ